MAGEVANPTLPLPTAADPARTASQASKPALQRPTDAPGRGFAEELGRQTNAAKDFKPDQPQGPLNDPVKNAPVDPDDAATGAKRALQPLKKVAQTCKQVIDDTPVVAFLTGHLEKLDPTEIPSLLTGNEFLNVALGEGDLLAFLNRPAPVADLVEALDLPPSLISDAERLGLDLNKPVAPTEFLKAIGIDPQRVFSELKVLRETLAANGVSGYLDRATNLRSKDAAPSKNLAAADERVPAKVKGNARPEVPALGTVPDMPTMRPAPTKVAAPAPNRPSGAPAALPSLASPNAEEANSDALAAALLLGAPLLMMPKAQEVVADIKTEIPDLKAPATPRGSLPVLDLTNLNLAPDPSALASLPNQVIKTAPDATPKVNAAAPTMANATFDAFAALGDKLAATDTKSIKFDPQPLRSNDEIQLAPPNLNEDLLSRSFPSQQSLVTAPPVSAPLAQPLVAQQPQQSTPALPNINAAMLAKPIPAAAVTAPDQRLTADLITKVEAPSQVPVPASVNLFDQLTSNAPRSKAVAIDDLRLTAPVATERLIPDAPPPREQKGDQKSDQQGENQRDALPFNTEKLASELAAAKHAPTHRTEHSFASHLAADPVLSPAQRADMMQQIVDRATILNKAGGGTVRLDLGSPELGPLEMAINLASDRLDVRVVTASDRVRDLVLKDLNGLRDALAVQNVQLGRVDVGIGGRPQGGFAGFNGAFQGQQQFRDEQPRQERSAEPSALIQSIQSVRRPLPFPAMTATANSGGRIALRV